MPASKYKKKKTKKELHEAIGELLHSAKVRLEMLSHHGTKSQKEQTEKALSEVRRAHSAFKQTLGRR